MTGSNPMRILVADDNPDDRALVLHELKGLFPHAEIIELWTAKALGETLAAGDLSLVVTDLNLRFAQGHEVLAAVKQRCPNCPVVMYTGTGSETIAVELMKAGLDDYVVKAPHRLPRLRMALKRAVELAGSRAALNDREARLASSLERQRVIVRELHHRVKNNLQMVSSLLQFGGLSADEATRQHLEQISGRMHALGAVQARIYDTERLDQVDFRSVLNDIATSLMAMREGCAVTLDTQRLSPLDLEVARAMPLSLLCYEVILNAMKHAWPQGEAGTLTVGIRTEGGKSEVLIADNGAGFDDARSAGGVGIRLIRSLASEAQVTVETTSRPGVGTRVLLKVL